MILRTTLTTLAVTSLAAVSLAQLTSAEASRQIATFRNHLIANIKMRGETVDPKIVAEKVRIKARKILQEVKADQIAQDDAYAWIQPLQVAGLDEDVLTLSTRVLTGKPSLKEAREA